MDMYRHLLILLLLSGVCYGQTPQHYLLGGTDASITYATWSPTNKSTRITLSGGNLTATGSTGTGTGIATAALTGKMRWQLTVVVSTGTIEFMGMAQGFNTTQRMILTAQKTAAYFGGVGGSGICMIHTNGAGGSTNVGAGCTVPIAADVFDFAFDNGTNELKIFRNGSLVATATITAGTYYPCFGSSAAGASVTANFGASPWVYSDATLGLTGTWTGVY